MSENIKQEDLIETVTPAVEEKVETEIKPEVTTEQDPLKIELDKVRKSGRTEKDKAEFSLKKTAAVAKTIKNTIM